MAFTPRFSLLLKLLLRRRYTAAAEGLFMEGSIEFEAGDLESARLAFTYGTRLDPRFAGNFHNLALTIERMDGPGPAALAAWREYLRVADLDPRQSAEAKAKVRAHLAKLEAAAPAARA